MKIGQRAFKQPTTAAGSPRPAPWPSPEFAPRVRAALIAIVAAVLVVLTTGAMRLTYLGVGPFTPLNVSVAIGSITAHPAWDACQDLIGSCSSVGLTGLANSIGSWTPEVWSVAVHGKDLSWCVAGTLPWRAGVRPSADTLSTLYDLGLTRRGGLTS